MSKPAYTAPLTALTQDEIYAWYLNLPPIERQRIDAVAGHFMKHIAVRGFGYISAIELAVKLLLFIRSRRKG